MQLTGFVAGWTDGSEVNILSAWTSEDEAKAACQQDQRDGEDMGVASGDPLGPPVAESERFTLEWETSEQIAGATADCGNGQGTYFVHKV